MDGEPGKGKLLRLILDSGPWTLDYGRWMGCKWVVSGSRFQVSGNRKQVSGVGNYKQQYMISYCK